MDSLIIVHSGESWSHQLPPCSRSMVRFLERNEEVVTWVQVCFAVSWRLAASGGDRSVWQPRDGRVEDQFPVIKMNGLYFSMSLRMMKAVWFVPRAGLNGTAKTEHRARLGRRNVRLKRGFVNVERAPFGGVKLRIPTLLFAEKMRTQSRFNVSHLQFVFAEVVWPCGAPVLKPGLAGPAHAHGGDSAAGSLWIVGATCKGAETRAQRLVQGEPGRAADAFPDAGFPHADARPPGHGRRSDGAGPARSGGEVAARRAGGSANPCATPREPRGEVPTGRGLYPSFHAAVLTSRVRGAAGLHLRQEFVYGRCGVAQGLGERVGRFLCREQLRARVKDLLGPREHVRARLDLCCLC